MKSAPPETLRQAQTWESVKGKYLTLGLCSKCAAQAAWGHQNNADGWAELNPPCPACTPIVMDLPTPTPNPRWRKILRPVQVGVA